MSPRPATAVRLAGGFVGLHMLFAAGLFVTTLAARADADQTTSVSQPVVVVEERFTDTLHRAPRPGHMVPRHIARRGNPEQPPSSEAMDAAIVDAINRSKSSTTNQRAASPDIPAPRIGESFTKFPGPQQLGFIAPPDPVLAVGDTYIVAATNSEIAVYTRNGGRVFAQDWAAFFQAADPQGAVDFTSDPKVFYDARARRFFVMILGLQTGGQGGGVNGSNYLIAVTQTDDPTQVWRKFLSETTANSSWSDYPGFGFDDNALYITANYFNNNTGQFAFAGLRVYPKAQFLGVLPPQTLAFTQTLDLREGNDTGPLAFTVQPAISLDATTTEWLVSVPFNALNETRVFLYSLDGGAAPRNLRRFTINLPSGQSYSRPDFAIQPDGQPIDALDGRMLSVKKMGNSIWAAHAVLGASGPAAVRWYEFDITNINSPVLRQTGLIGIPNGSCFNPAICPNAVGDAVVTYTRCNGPSREFLSMYYSARSASEPLGTMLTTRAVELGSAAYSSFIFRWGDYAEAALDPLDNSSVWIINELPSNAFQWRTVIARVSLNPAGAGGGSVICPSTLDLLSPDGGELGIRGQPMEIRWTGNNVDQPGVLVNLLVARFDPAVQASVIQGFILNGSSIDFNGAAGAANWVVGDPVRSVDDPSVLVDLPDSGDFADYQIVVQTAFLCAPGGGDRLRDASTNFFRIVPRLEVSLSATSTTIERGESTTLTASAIGGKPPYTFRWTPPESLDNPTIFRPVATPRVGPDSTCDPDLDCITYTCEVRDSGGLFAQSTTASIVIKIGDPLVVSAGPTKAFVPGGTVLLEGSATGGAKPYTYSWSPVPDPTQAPPNDGSTQPQPLARPEQDTIYTLTVTDRIGTIRSASVNVLRGFTLSLVAQPANGGSIGRNPVKALYAPGEVITFAATPAAGFSFVRWEIGPVGGPISQFFETTVPVAMPAANLSVQAVFSSSPGGAPRPATGTSSGNNGPLPSAAICGGGTASATAALSLALTCMLVARRGRRR